jgi:hypothetical protein
MDGAQRHLPDHRPVAFFDLLLCAREDLDSIPGGHVPVVPVEWDHRLRWQFPLNDGFRRIWPVHSTCLVRNAGLRPLKIRQILQGSAALLRQACRSSRSLASR